MTELTIASLVEALGGWEIVVRAGAVVGLAFLIQSGLRAAGKNPGAFVKRGTAFISAAIVAFLYVGPGEQLGREVITNWFAGTILWGIALKPVLNKIIEGWKPNGGQ